MPAWLENALNAIADWLDVHAVTILIILVVALFIQLVGKRLISKTIRKAVTLDTLVPRGGYFEEKRQDTLIRIFNGLLGIVVWTVAIAMIFSEIGVAIGPMLAAAGVAGIAIGFGGQYLIRDLITGTFIIIENQYRLGDIVCIEGVCGEVEDITLRKTTLRDIDGVVHHVPHGEIKVVSNRSKSFSRVNIDIGIAYGADIDQATATINRVGQEMAADPLWKEQIIAAPVFLRVEDLADSAVVLKVTGDTSPGEQLRVAGELRKRVKEAFEREGIEIPFPQRVIHQAKD
jgi:small-conductance mechanosensitive channel